MLGSRAWVGELSDASSSAQLRNAAGQTYLEAGAPTASTPHGSTTTGFDRERYLGLIEVHIEQGPGMWRRDQRLAVVTAIAGRRQYRVTINGEANHAGATSMADRTRRARRRGGVHRRGSKARARSRSADAVITVGRIECHPNAINVIPDRVEFTIDFRSARRRRARPTATR